MTHYPSANLNKDLPIVPVKAGKWSVGDWLVMGLGSLFMICFFLTLLHLVSWKIILAVLAALVVANRMFFRELIAPQRNPFATKE